MKQALYLIAYDITDPRRLARIARYLTRCAVRVQYSVFAAEFDRATLAQVTQDLADLIDPWRDDIRIYPVPRNGQVALLGRQIFPEDIMLLHDGFNLLQLSRPLLPVKEAPTHEGTVQ